MSFPNQFWIMHTGYQLFRSHEGGFLRTQNAASRDISLTAVSATFLARTAVPASRCPAAMQLRGIRKSVKERGAPRRDDFFCRFSEFIGCSHFAFQVAPASRFQLCPDDFLATYRLLATPPDNATNTSAAVRRFDAL